MPLIIDKEEAKKFFDAMVPELDDSQALIMFLVARKKYGGISRSEEMLMGQYYYGRGFDEFWSKLLRFDVPEEAYIDRGTNKPIPKSSMAIYVDLTPKNIVRGILNAYRDVFDMVLSGDRSAAKRLNRIMFSSIHKTNSVKPAYIIIDVDNKALYNKVMEYLADKEIPVKWITETHGGYHIFVPKGKWLGGFRRDELPTGVEVLRQNQTPVPGTMQGGVLVRGIEQKDL